MRSFITFLFAGAMITAAANDPGADERFRMKWGRPSAVQEKTAECAEMNCCRRLPCEKPAATARAKADDAEARFRAKWGRSTPPRERAGTPTIPAPSRMALNDGGAAERFRLKTGRTNPAAAPATLEAAAAGCQHDCCNQVHASGE